MTDAEHVTDDRISAAGSGPETWQLVVDLRAQRDSILTELADRQVAYRGATLRVAEAEERAEKAEKQLQRISRNQGWFDPDGPTPLEQAEARIQELEAALADSERRLIEIESEQA